MSSPAPAAPTPPTPPVMAALGRFVDIAPNEVAAVAWSWLYFFAVLSAYYVIRPIRDAMGVEGGVENLPWLFTGSLVGMLVANPPFAYLVARLPRRRFVTLVYRFFIANLVAFFLLFHYTSAIPHVWIGRAFFIWTSVFNMFVVSVFYSVVSDVFTTSQGKRLFGFIGAGGTLGSMTGAGLTAALVGPLGSTNLLLLSAVFLELAILSASRLFRLSTARSAAGRPVHAPEAAVGGTVWESLGRAFRDVYFLNITVYMLLFTVLTTFLYFQQAAIVDRAIAEGAARTAFFARIDFLVNLAALATQVCFTGRLVKAVGVPAALAFLPAASIIGFLALGLAPTIATLMVFQVLRRAGNFAVARPVREVLFTVVPREDKYKVRTFIDTFVYRAGDQVGAWSFAALAAAGLGIPGVSAVAIVLSLASVANAVWLGRRQEARAAASGQRVTA